MTWNFSGAGHADAGTPEPVIHAETGTTSAPLLGRQRDLIPGRICASLNLLAKLGARRYTPPFIEPSGHFRAAAAVQNVDTVV